MTDDWWSGLSILPLVPSVPGQGESRLPSVYSLHTTHKTLSSCLPRPSHVNPINHIRSHIRISPPPFKTPTENPLCPGKRNTSSSHISDAPGTKLRLGTVCDTVKPSRESWSKNLDILPLLLSWMEYSNNPLDLLYHDTDLVIIMVDSNNNDNDSPQYTETWISPLLGH